MMVQLNAEEIRHIVHEDNTNIEIPARVMWEVRRYLRNADGTFPPDEDLPVWFRDYGLESDKQSEASTDWVHRHKP
jgi:hypothetical protein